jgi:hypothetical protein
LLESARICENPPNANDPLTACAAVAMQRGTVRALRNLVDPDEKDAAVPEPPRSDGEAVDLDGFNLHAGVAVAGDDDLGRERLMRYGARPPFALDRLRRLPDGRIAYRIKKLRDGRAKHRVMTPLELLARLSAIIPPPRFPLVRYAGVLGPRSRWRRELAPRPREPDHCSKVALDDATPSRSPPQEPRRGRANGTDSRRASAEAPAPALPERATVPASPVLRTFSLGPPVGTSSAATVLAPNAVSVQHWQRLLGGLLYAAAPRIGRVGGWRGGCVEHLRFQPPPRRT